LKKNIKTYYKNSMTGQQKTSREFAPVQYDLTRLLPRSQKTKEQYIGDILNRPKYTGSRSQLPPRSRYYDDNKRPRFGPKVYITHALNERSTSGPIILARDIPIILTGATGPQGATDATGSQGARPHPKHKSQRALIKPVEPVVDILDRNRSYIHKQGSRPTVSRETSTRISKQGQGSGGLPGTTDAEGRIIPRRVNSKKPA
jgi:hypothetical protein